MEAPVKPTIPYIPKVLGSLPSFAISGKFSDFEIRCGCYSFMVHKVIVAAASKPFETLCGGPFKETIQCYATLDEDPVIVARLIQALYEGEYGSIAQETALPKMLGNAKELCQFHGCTPDHVLNIDTVNIILHAKMYALGDRHDIPNLRSLALFKFTIGLMTATTDDILAAAAVIYDSLPINDDNMRKEVVYYCQTNMLEISHLAAFKELMADADFSWDFGTKYASRAHVWCTSCGTWTRISVDCNCGFHGLCGKSNECNYHLWGMLKCKWCNKKGHLTREDPDRKKMVAVVREDANASVCGNPIVVPSKTKKRKMTDDLQY